MRLILLVLLLTSCSAPNKELPQPKPSANSLTRCASLKSPKEGEGVEAYITYLIDRYYDCALRHDALVQYQKQATP